MNFKRWMIAGLAFLLLDATVVTWVTVQRLAQAQNPGTKEIEPATASESDPPQGNPSSAAEANGVQSSNASKQPVVNATANDVKIDVQPATQVVSPPGEVFHLPTVPSLTAPQLPNTSIRNDMVLDELKKFVSGLSQKPVEISGDDSAADAVSGSSPQVLSDDLESIENRLRIAEHLLHAAQAMIQESRRLHAGKKNAAAVLMTNQSRQQVQTIVELLKQAL